MYFHSLGITWIIFAIIAVVPFWRLCARIGYSPWLSLLILVPLVNIIFIYFLAFSDWPSPRGGSPAGTTATPL
jgi:uncharacterized membrane protein YhaH (DUF805 family)